MKAQLRGLRGTALHRGFVCTPCLVFVLSFHGSARAGDSGASPRENTSGAEEEATALSLLLSEEEQDGKLLKWKYDGGFKAVTNDEKFSAKINLRIQTRATYTDLDHDRRTATTPAAIDTMEFNVNRLRLKVAGYAFTKETTYEFQADFASKAGSGGELRDGFLNQKVLGDAFQIRGGQFKQPFSRQQLMSTANLQFVDRAITDAEFAPGREPGAMLHGVLGDGNVVEWGAAVSNGRGQNNVNGDSHPRFTGRIVLNPLGDPGLGESDEKQSENLRPSIGASVTGNSVNASGPDRDVATLGLEAALRGRGAYVAGEFFHRYTNVQGGGDDASDVGFYAQAGCFVLPKRVEVGIRYSQNRFDDVVAGAGVNNVNGANVEKLSEIAAVLGWFLFGHNMKLQADLAGLFTDPFGGSGVEDLIDVVARFQAQIQV